MKLSDKGRQGVCDNLRLAAGGPLRDAVGLVLGLTVGDTVGMMLNLLGGPLGDARGLVTGLIIHTTGGKRATSAVTSDYQRTRN